MIQWFAKTWKQYPGMSHAGAAAIATLTTGYVDVQPFHNWVDSLGQQLPVSVRGAIVALGALWLWYFKGTKAAQEAYGKKPDAAGVVDSPQGEQSARDSVIAEQIQRALETKKEDPK